MRLAYRDMYNRHLHQDIEKDTSFNFRDVLMGLVMSDAEFRAYILRKATKGAGTRGEHTFSCQNVIYHDNFDRRFHSY